MYDLSKHGAGEATSAGAPARLSKPSLLLTACEIGSFSVELPASLLVDALVPAANEGRGRPVLVLPGFYSPDVATSRCRSHLRRLGYAPHGWGLGRNYGLTDEIIDGVLARLDEVQAGHDEPVSVVGWSFGGLLARWVAHQRPDRVRQVICLGSPYRPEGEHTRTTPLFERSARTHGLSGRTCEVVDDPAPPTARPGSAIYSQDRRHSELARSAGSTQVKARTSRSPAATWGSSPTRSRSPRWLTGSPRTRSTGAVRLGTVPESWVPRRTPGPPRTEGGVMAADRDDLPEEDRDRLAYRDGKYVAGLIPLLRLVVRTWFRSEVTGMENMPPRAAP